ncbi:MULTISPECIES: N,N-dimethylformamidase beta subunit family domain-containing protein [Nostocales]|uniref:DUF4082 domain-containing protein n=3 Tax=Nostocales TaxID=1161 RepID=A0A0C1RBP1_9CYAN|nr:N,N-dimethylformamidase beta subunit family domain-containing protein [Tolypothrix bouteillei]KAF3884582.1 DUF4082 domain-containing protein [Tolypothrix bouteillei VB521301]
MKKLLKNILLMMLAILVVLQLSVGDRVPMQKVLAADPCTSPANSIVAENCKAGNPASEWDISGIGDSSIQGFATDISVNRGQTVSFKIKTPAPSYRLDIYRMGYYGGQGARKVATVNVPQNQTPSQPNCINNATTGLIDCGNWGVSASWNVPENATSGIYFAKAVRTDTSGASHIVFIVRDDSSTSDLLFQTSDTTWQAYNNYGGNSLYTGSPAGRAYKVSYNRPFNTRIVDNGQDWVFNAEYPMVRWLEANGYDVSYFTGVDSDRFGDLIRNHQVFLSVGHDEYWSAQQRAKVEAARNIGVHLAFFSGNEVFWKTRWENSIDISNAPYRTLVCYKETKANAAIDPEPTTWTGTWRDPRFSPPKDGGRPENALTGTLFTVNDGATTAIQVPAEDGKMRFWRNTSVATLSPGTTATLANSTLGYEWDEDIDNGFRPSGLIWLSTRTVNNAPVLQDYGSTFGSGTATHHLTLYRHSSGALVFGSGTVQWSWGLDINHDRRPSGATPDVRMQQATVNLFADMGVQPGSLQSGLQLATPSFDSTAPTATISSPTASTTVQLNNPIAITGTASDTDGVVGGVEVSVDGGTTWHLANGRANWNYTWTPTTTGTVTIKSRAIDDSGNIQTPATEVAIAVGDRACPCSIWNSSVTPGLITTQDSNAAELGVKFRANQNGYISGIRFYKGPQNTGTHVGTLWSSGGTQLARATFSNETSSGWQQVNFATPVQITANTVYVASYHTSVGKYSKNENFFTNSGVNSSPLYALRNGESGANGVYIYRSTPTFPTNTYQASNYWVDVVFTTNVAPDTTPPTVTASTPGNGTTGVSPSTTITATFSEAIDTATLNSNTFELRNANNTLVPATITYDAGNSTATLTPSSPLATSTTYTATLKGGSTDPRVKDLAGNALAQNYTWSFTTGNASSVTVSIWNNTATPNLITENDPSSVELGVKFRSSQNGFIKGIRFYKGPQNTGTHVGTLWSSNGQQLATATFINETASGWQQVNFGAPVAITANTVYVASYHTNVGFYSQDVGYFANSGVSTPPLSALRNGESGPNGVYTYSSNPAFPTSTYQSANYWVDVIFSTTN